MLFGFSGSHDLVGVPKEAFVNRTDRLSLCLLSTLAVCHGRFPALATAFRLCTCALCMYVPVYVPACMSVPAHVHVSVVAVMQMYPTDTVWELRLQLGASLNVPADCVGFYLDGPDRVSDDAAGAFGLQTSRNERPVAWR